MSTCWLCQTVVHMWQNETEEHWNEECLTQTAWMWISVCNIWCVVMCSAWVEANTSMLDRYSVFSVSAPPKAPCVSAAALDMWPKTYASLADTKENSWHTLKKKKKQKNSAFSQRADVRCWYEQLHKKPLFTILLAEHPHSKSLTAS